MQQASVPAPYRRLVQMIASAFYTGECPPYEGPADGPARKGTNVRSQRQATCRLPSQCIHNHGVAQCVRAALHAHLHCLY